MCSWAHVKKKQTASLGLAVKTWQHFGTGMRKTGLGSTYMQKTCLSYKVDTQSGPDHLCFNPIGANLCLGILPPFRRHEWFKRITQTTVFDSFLQWYSFFTPKRELLLSLPLLLTKERVSDSLQSDGSYLLFCMSKSLFSPQKKRAIRSRRSGQKSDGSDLLFFMSK